MRIKNYAAAMLMMFAPVQALANEGVTDKLQGLFGGDKNGPAVADSVFEQSFRERRIIQLDAASVPELTEEVVNAPVLVRLHGGVFDFTKAAPDGSDLRFVTPDGTPLDYHIERYDPVAALGLIWVEVPSVEPAVTQNIWLYYSDETAMKVANSLAVYDGEFAYVLNMSEDATVPVDQTANNNRFVANDITPTLGGAIAGGMEFGPQSAIRATAERSLNVDGGTGQLSWSAWIMPAAKQPDGEASDVGSGAESEETNQEIEASQVADGLIFTKLSAAGDEGPNKLSFGIRDGRLFANLAGVSVVSETAVSADVWTHVAVVADGEALRIYLNGALTADVPATMPELYGEEVIGAVGSQPGFVGTMDEVRRSNTARSASYIALGAKTEGRSADFVRVAPEGESTKAGEHNYFGILLNALTPDAWAVIIILAIMSVISWMIMFGKGQLLGRTKRANDGFYKAYREATRGGNASAALIDTNFSKKFNKSTLARMFRVGQTELLDRISNNEEGETYLTLEEVASIRSALDASQAREEQHLSKRMVLLTIAISGGPFLGLLGTVLGVMITFAGVAAVGEVNVTAIAPGIAAALLATVAGLAVAIPALFGYNYLNGQLERLITDNVTFVDELEKRIAETYRSSRTA